MGNNLCKYCSDLLGGSYPSLGEKCTCDSMDQRSKYLKSFLGLSYSVYITDTITGVQKEILQTLPWNESSSYGWSEGNMSCDCNRGRLFYKNNEYVCNTINQRFTVDKFIFKGHPSEETLTEEDLGVTLNKGHKDKSNKELLEVAKLIEKSTINTGSGAKAEFSFELWDRLRHCLYRITDWHQ